MLTRQPVSHTLVLIIGLLISLISCKTEKRQISAEEKEEIPLQQGPLLLPSWAINGSLYEVNIANYTEEGTFKSFATHLPRLKEMGVDILCLLPIQPISSGASKSENSYSIVDYITTNPDMGSKEDFVALLQQVHELGMYLILDWPASNMSAEMSQKMVENMRFWVEEMGIDGFRCEIENIPLDFWKEVRNTLDEIKPVLMVASSEGDPEHFNVCFNANSGGQFHQLINDIVSGKKDATAIEDFLSSQRSRFPEHYFQTYSTARPFNGKDTSHSEAWNRSAEAMNVLALTLHGMPLISGGQETGENQRLSLQSKEPIKWEEHKRAGIYKTLLDLKKTNKAMWNGPFGGEVKRVNSEPSVFAFERLKDGDAVLVIINLSGESQLTEINTHYHHIKDVFSGRSYDIHEGEVFNLPPFAYLVLSGEEYTGGHH
jgi:glycosidase